MKNFTTNCWRLLVRTIKLKTPLPPDTDSFPLTHIIVLADIDLRLIRAAVKDANNLSSAEMLQQLTPKEE